MSEVLESPQETKAAAFDRLAKHLRNWVIVASVAVGIYFGYANPVWQSGTHWSTPQLGFNVPLSLAVTMLVALAHVPVFLLFKAIRIAVE